MTTHERPTPEVRAELRRSGPLGAGLFVVLLLGACGPSADRPLQGYVEGEYVRIAAPFGGTLQQLAVQRGDDVAAGAPVFALERDNEVAARRQAEQQLQAARARLENLKSGKRPTEVATVAEQLRQAIAVRELSVANLKRVQDLHASGFVSSAALDDARTQQKRDEAQVASLQASVATAKLPARADEIRAAEADVRAAREVLAQADWRLAQRAIPAPARVESTTPTTSSATGCPPAARSRACCRRPTSTCAFSCRRRRWAACSAASR